MTGDQLALLEQIIARVARRDLDELERRVHELERRALPPAGEHDARSASPEQETLTFTMSEWVEQRRRVVVRMRRAGLSLPLISEAVGAGRSTIVRDLQAAGAETPARVLGLNGRSWSRRTGTNGTRELERDG